MFSSIIYLLIAAIGFITVFIYRQANTSAQLFRPRPRNTMKLFLTVFVIAIVVTFSLSYLVTYQLTSSVIPADSQVKFQNEKSIMIFVMNLFLFLLVIISNIYSLAQKKIDIIPYLLTAGFYVLFTLKDTYFISDYYSFWQKSLLLLKGDMPDFHRTGWIKCILGTGVILLNAAMVWWVLRKKK